MCKDLLILAISTFASFFSVTLLADEITHQFLACGQNTVIIDAKGNVAWSFPHSTRDGYMLEDGSLLLTLSKSERHPGGAVVEVAKDGAERLIWSGTQAEVNSAQPTASGTIVLTEAGPNPRLVEVEREGKIHVEFPLKCQLHNHHMQTRMARKLDNNSYLVPHLLDFAVTQYDAKGSILKRFDTSVSGDEQRTIHTWPFTAIRHGEGHTLVCCTNGNRIIDLDAEGNIVWTLVNEDLPGAWLQDPCGGQVLPNGNVVIASYGAGQVDVDAPKLIEVTPEKEVVWTYRDGQKTGIHHFQILDTNGVKLEGLPLK